MPCTGVKLPADSLTTATDESLKERGKEQQRVKGEEIGQRRIERQIPGTNSGEKINTQFRGAVKKRSLSCS